MHDPVLALQFQCWYAQDNSTPAPLVSVYATNGFRTNTHIWLTIKQTPTFWGKTDPELFRHASSANAKISQAGFTDDGPIKYLSQTPLVEWLGRIEKNARPWDELLEEKLHTLPPE